MSNLKSLRLPSDQEKRLAIRQRNPAYNGVFLYAVVTTGVFCVPSCPSRPARPENLRFFTDSDEAIAAGYRPCKRCKPLTEALQTAALVEVARYIEAHATEVLTLESLSKQTQLSPSALQKKFVALFGLSPKALQDHWRKQKLKQGLRTKQKIANSIYDAGYSSSSSLYQGSQTPFAMSPASYQAGGAGEEISYALADSSYGKILLAATDSGVCFTQFGESREQLLSALKSEFPDANLQAAKSGAKSAEALRDWIAALVKHLDGSAPRPDVPLDLRGTAFQIQVWKFLLQTKPGETLSYAGLAQGIKRDRAVRAAASACGANKIAVLIPCHRVLRGDGSLGGYRWSPERKQKLLDKEKSAD